MRFRASGSWSYRRSVIITLKQSDDYILGGKIIINSTSVIR